MSNFSKYVVKNNEEKIRAKIDEVLSNNNLKQNLLENAERYLEKEVEICKDEDLDKYIQNCMDSVRFVPAIMGNTIGTSEKVVEKVVVPKGMLVVKDSERPLIRYYLGKSSESECVILANIIKSYRAIDNELNEPHDLIETIRNLKRDSDELKKIKSTGKSVTFKSKVMSYFQYDLNKTRYLSKAELQNFVSGENLDTCIYQGIEEGWLVESERGFKYNG